MKLFALPWTSLATLFFKGIMHPEALGKVQTLFEERWKMQFVASANHLICFIDRIERMQSEISLSKKIFGYKNEQQHFARNCLRVLWHRKRVQNLCHVGINLFLFFFVCARAPGLSTAWIRSASFWASSIFFLLLFFLYLLDLSVQTTSSIFRRQGSRCSSCFHTN